MKHGDFFREIQQLKLLDDIAIQQYEGKLPPEVKGLLRGELIGAFLEIRGSKYVPLNVDKCLNWTATSKMTISTPSSYSEWKPVDTSKKNKNQASSIQPNKHKAQDEQVDQPPSRHAYLFCLYHKALAG